MSKTDKTDTSDDKQVATPTRTGSAAEKAGNTVRDAANKNGHAAREATASGSDVAREVTEQGREAVEAGHEAAREAVAKGHEVARDVVEQTVSAAEQSTEQSMAAFATATDYAGFWRALATEQLAHNVDAFQKLAAARTWPEQLAIQQGYLQGNVERLVEATSRCMALTDSMLGQQQQRRGNPAERRARA